MFTDKERKIIRELVANPRISDNQISKNTSIPVKTVNRKRKAWEEKGYLNYFTWLNNGPEGTGLLKFRQLYVIKFKEGLSVSDYFNAMKKMSGVWVDNTRTTHESHLGEWGGHLALIDFVIAESEKELNEIFNGQIIPNIKKRFGEDIVEDIIAFRLITPVRFFNNYVLAMNVEKGRIRNDYNKLDLFVDGR